MELFVGLASLAISVLLLILSVVVWVLAPRRGWLESVAFVSHLSLAALAFAAFSAALSALAALFAVGG